MLDSIYNYSSLGAVETTLPPHYLVPMTKAEIDAYIEKEKNLGTASKLHEGCSTTWAGHGVPCFIAMFEIERHNLYYVNNIISWDKLQAVYAEANRMLADIPVFPTLKEHLKNVGTFLVGAVAGFITAGPIGLFTGGAAATQKIISDARNKALMEASEKLTPLVQKTQEAQQQRFVIDQQKQMELQRFQASTDLKAALPVLIGTAFAGAALIYFGDDLKKQFKK